MLGCFGLVDDDTTYVNCIMLSVKFCKAETENNIDGNGLEWIGKKLVWDGLGYPIPFRPVMTSLYCPACCTQMSTVGVINW